MIKWPLLLLNFFVIAFLIFWTYWVLKSASNCSKLYRFVFIFIGSSRSTSWILDYIFKSGRYCVSKLSDIGRFWKYSPKLLKTLQICVFFSRSISWILDDTFKIGRCHFSKLSYHARSNFPQKPISGSCFRDQRYEANLF